MAAEEKKRERAAQHWIAWTEFEPYLGPLQEQGVVCKWRPGVGGLDASWDSIVTEGHEKKIAPVLDAIIKKKVLKTPLQRGDAVRMEFTQYRSYGVYFYDGAKVIPPEWISGSEYPVVPAVFKVLTEFPIDYWDDIRFVQFAQEPPFCFDLTLLAGKFPEAKPVAGIDGAIIAHLAKAGVNYLLVISEDGVLDRGRIDAFMKTGRCFDWKSTCREWQFGPLPDWAPEAAEVMAKRCICI